VFKSHWEKIVELEHHFQLFHVPTEVPEMADESENVSPEKQSLGLSLNSTASRTGHFDVQVQMRIAQPMFSHESNRQEMVPRESTTEFGHALLLRFMANFAPRTRFFNLLLPIFLSPEFF
jgi:hypothetical protein